MKKDSFMKDALVLALITLISGCCLGGAYGLTKQKIYEINMASTIESYKQVMPAEEYDDATYADALTTAQSDGKIAADNGGASLISVVAAKDASGAETGYIIKGSAAGYGGSVIVVVGVDADLKVTGISFPETLPETAGLGKKGGGAGEDEIDAISGATITSTAVTNTVNAATEFVQDYILK